MSERFVRHVFMHLLNGLREVHTNKLLHLDIKPANIYLRIDGSPVLLDFGAARQTLTGKRPEARADVHAGLRRARAVPRARPARARGPTSTASARRCTRASRRSRRRRPTRACRRTTSCPPRRSGGPVLGQPARGHRLVPAARPAGAAAERVRAAEARSATSRRRSASSRCIGNLKRRLFSEIGA